MRSHPAARRLLAVGALAASATLAFTSCSAGSLGSSSGGEDGGATTTITFLSGSTDTEVASAKALIAAFQKANPDITVKSDTRPGGSEGDNLVKTRLATGDMAEVFSYNNGSLLQAIKPEQNLTPLDGESWAGQLDENFANSSKGTDGKLYGAPLGTAFGGGVLYNIPVYKKLGLEVPKTWDEFMANNSAIKDAGGVTPVEQTYGETWTSQLFVLGDYHNVEAQAPNFAADYTANKAHYADTPAALAGFQHIQEVKDAGYLNKDFASAKLNDGIKAVATGEAAHYPQLGGSASNIENVAPGNTNDVGFFALPGDNAEANGLTIWPGTSALYVPKSVEGDKLDAAKKFVAFAATQEGCDAAIAGNPPQGPFLSKACKLPADVSQVAKDTQAYIDAGKASPALEFKSPIKGPNLEQICIQVGTGQETAEKAAALYDADVKKQAQQLGLPGWD
ncbi:putative ABC transporter substrate-binding protein [Microlunatus phosphovorus NM-1]|uniref:Putative ABC transporter substrate-binding protein n=1 Tax=Microlunatus phosphovorus (strain ATCC 700054 / DSM 10555 / JCM 9379 / NBRC 101784 / NCIMB 13414 / VKM Ac-1990 / NM-1) TaxID=1032480 RepID=F5XMQ5_MICPN|nr:extracellular solute-binding protein [Microlunatus phosphovorus]BAK33978.1 putative ABC transporter substrate-binding protein [Microlunatus phosphovorus NM-1]